MRGFCNRCSSSIDDQDKFCRACGTPVAGTQGVPVPTACVVIVLFGVARNLPFHPFNLLAPGASIRL